MANADLPASNQQDPSRVESLHQDWISSNSYVPDYPLLMAGDRLVGTHMKRVLYVINAYTGAELNTAGSKPGGGFPYSCKSQQKVQPVVTDGALFFVER